MKIEVTQEHIDKGTPCTASDCPVALAIGHNCRVYIHSVTINGLKYSIPENVTDFIDRFDAGHSVQPFTFELKT